MKQDGKFIYSTSSDQRICEFNLTPAQNGAKRGTWSQTTKRRVHSHDVRALICSPQYEHGSDSGNSIPILLSGGLDMSLQLTPCASQFESLEEGPSIRRGPLSNSADCSFASGAGRALSYVNQLPSGRLLSFSHERDLIALRQTDSCSIWRFSENQHAKVLSIKLKGFTNTTVGSISPDGQWLCSGDLWRIKLWRLIHVCLSAFCLMRLNRRSRTARIFS